MKESNKLIAEFMGQKYDMISDDGCVIFARGHLGQSIISYNKSWDALMSVVEKIASNDCSRVDIHTGTGCTDTFSWCDIEWFDGKNKFITSDEINQDEQNTLTATHTAVVEFIKWYNKQYKS